MKKIGAALMFILLLASFQMIAGNETPVKKNEASAPTVHTVTVKGRVIDVNNREGLAGAEITVKTSGIKVFTDLDGNFEITGLTPGQYTLICSMISYNASLLENVEVKPETSTLEIALEEIK